MYYFLCTWFEKFVFPVIVSADILIYWLQPSKGLVNAMDSLLIYNDPYGVVLVMGSWNYPIQLTLLPVVGAIAAGNCVIIKPSPMSPASADLVASLIPKYLDQVIHTLVAWGGLENYAPFCLLKVSVCV
jgi:acyl-CoA reductase-like NAD-dependent aldehyde dehydrogenase